jgi:hypothetical protein
MKRSRKSDDAHERIRTLLGVAIGFGIVVGLGLAGRYSGLLLADVEA